MPQQMEHRVDFMDWGPGSVSCSNLRMSLVIFFTSIWFFLLEYRLYFNTPDGPLERVPAWATYVQPEDEVKQAYAIHWELSPETAYKWKNSKPDVPKSLRIYECHVGISGSDPKITTFEEFTKKVLPHVKRAGYNAIHLIGNICFI